MKICKSCGSAVPEENKFCSSCGAPTPSNPTKNKDTSKNKRIFKTAIIITTVIAILCIVIPLSLTFAKNAQVKSNTNLGNKYLSEGKYEEAILAFEKIISVDKKNVDARLKLTEAYLKTGRFKDADKMSMEILDIDPSDKGIYIKLADIMVAAGRPDDAVAYLKKVFDKTKDTLVQQKLEAIKLTLAVPALEASVTQDNSYKLPETVKLMINNVEQEKPVKWVNTSVDTKTPGTYTFEGSVVEYDRKVKLTLEVKPKDLYLISGKEVNMDKKLKEDLDDFFTVFSYLHVKPFQNSDISDEELIRFGIEYIDWREWNSKVDLINTNEGSMAAVKASDVDEKCLYYFDKKPSAHKSIDYYKYNDGKYSYPPADGDAFEFSQADRLFDLGDNIYKVEISTYVGSSGFTGNIHASSSEILSGSYDTNENYAEAGRKMTAVVKKVTENNSERYILVSYKLKDSSTTTPAPNTAAANFSSWQASASSSLTENTGPHPAGFINDKDINTAWVEGSTGDGIGEWIKLSGAGQQSLSGLKIINGYAKSSNTYTKNNRIKKIQIELSDGSVLVKSLADGNMGYQTVSLDAPIKTDFVKISILEVYRGTQYRDTCLSEIELY